MIKRLLAGAVALVAATTIAGTTATAAQAEPKATSSNGWVICHNLESDIYPVTERVRVQDAYLVGYTWYCIH